MREVAGSAATATLSCFVATRFDYFDAIPSMFRFTIRDVLWLTVVVALLTAWWLDRIGTNNMRSDIQARNLEEVTALMKENSELRMKVDALSEADRQISN